MLLKSSVFVSKLEYENGNTMSQFKKFRALSKYEKTGHVWITDKCEVDKIPREVHRQAKVKNEINAFFFQT